MAKPKTESPSKSAERLLPGVSLPVIDWRKSFAVIIGVAAVLCVFLTTIGIVWQVLPGLFMFLPHAHCFLGRTDVIAAFAVANTLVAAAYMSIPLDLVRNRYIKRRLTAYTRQIYWMFGAFILACGMTHVMDVLTLWWPAYGMQAIVVGLTAAISLPTAMMLRKLTREWAVLPPPTAIVSMMMLLYARIENGTATSDERGAYAQCEHEAQAFFRLDEK